MLRVSPRWLVLVLPVLVLAACERTKSANPLSPSIAGPIAGVEIAPPAFMVPEADSQIAVDDQPITLKVANATTNGVRPVSYIFEIGTDASFATKVFSQSGVEPGEEQTTLTLPQTLAPEQGYFWRVKADDGANASEYSTVASFYVYTPVVLQPPVLREPAENEVVSTRHPTFVVTNAERSGPAGAIEYLVEVATDPAMADKVVSVLIEEDTEETRFTPPDPLAYETVHYWRVKTIDPGHESAYSEIRSFMTPPAPVIAPPPAPVPGIPPPAPGTPGPVAGDDINLNAATILNSPYDLASWPITTSITALDLRPSGVHVEFSKQYGPDRWPDVYPPGWDETLQYTLGMCLSIDGTWYCSAPIQFWYGLDENGGPPSQYIENWFYDPARWSPMSSHQLSVGEMIGFFVCAGNCRNNTTGSNSIVQERTNVVLVPFPGAGGRSFTF